MEPQFIAAAFVDLHAHSYANMIYPVLGKEYISISYNAYKQTGVVRIKTSIANIHLTATIISAM